MSKKSDELLDDDKAAMHKQQQEEALKKWEKRAAEDEDLQGLVEHPSYEELQAQLTATEKQLQEHKDAWLRAEAHRLNDEKRAKIDIANAHKYAADKILNAILPVLDSLEQSLELMESAKDKFKDIHAGLTLTSKMFQSAVEQFGVSQLNPLGEAFNPSYHQAMAMEESETAKPGTVLAVLQKGYTLHDRLLRPALVKVAKQKEA
ncbi:nucleotide exchange factor GrpE [soil metagenome]